jgi:WD40 repeat protein
MGGAVNYLAFSGDGKALAAASDDKFARIFDLPTGKTISIRHQYAVNFAEIAGSNSFIVTASSDNTVHVFDHAGQRVKEQRYKDAITAVAGGGNPPSLAIGVHGDLVRLVDPETFKQRITVGHSSAVKFIRFSGDREHVLTADDKTVSHFKISPGTEISRVVVDGELRAVGYSRNGRFALTAFLQAASHELIVVQYPLASQDLLKDACDRLDERDLTDDNRLQYRQICSGRTK